MTPEQVAAATHEVDRLNRHVMTVQARLRLVIITERRGPATVTMNGLGALQNLSIEGVDQDLTDCLIAAVRACEARAQQGYEAFRG